MKTFKVEIEIYGYDEKYCADCNINDLIYTKGCPIFNENREFDDKQSDFIRCAKCVRNEYRANNL